MATSTTSTTLLETTQSPSMNETATSLQVIISNCSDNGAATGSSLIDPGGQRLQELQISPDTPSRSKARLWSIVFALYLVMFIAALDQTIIATAIPTITASLNSAAGYTWLGGAYLLANAIAGPLWTKCSDIFGRKILLLAAVALFAAASLVAALSTTMPMLIAARALQGSAGGGLFQLVAVTISDLFSIRERALYFGIMGGVWAVAGSAGPLLGGALSEKASWRYCFWINLPVCGLSFVLLMVFLDVHHPRTKLKQGVKVIDWYGTACFLAFSLLVLLGLNFGGGAFAWNSVTVICLLVVGSCMIGLFLFSEQRLARYPLMPMHIFKTLSNNAVIITAIGHSMVSIGTEFYLPLYFQSVRQASPLRSGILLLPLTCTAAATDIAAGFLIHRVGRYKELIMSGVVLMTLGTGLCISLGTDTALSKVIGFQIISGAGIALLFQTPMLAIHNTVAQSDVASAGSTLGFLRALATSVSIVLGGVVFQNGISAQHSALSAAGLDAPILEALSGDTAAANVDIVKIVSDALQKHTIQDAFALSIRNIFIVYASIAGVTVVASLFVKQGHMSTEHTETKTGIDNMSKRQVELSS